MAKTDVGQAMATRMDTAAGAWEIFLGVVESLEITIGRNFLPVWKDMVRWVTNFASANAGQINTFFEGLAARLTAVWAVFRENGLMAALGELGNQLNYFYNTFMAWLTNSGILGQIQATLASWSAAFAEWAIGLWNVHVWPRLMEFWKGLTSWFTDPAKRQVLIDTLAGWGQAAWQWIVDMVPVAQRKLAEWGGSVGKWVTDNLPNWQANLSTWAEAAWKWIVDSAPKVWAKLGEWGASVGKYVTDNLPNWQANLATWGQAAWKWIVDAIPQVATKLAELWDKTLKPWLDEHTGGWGTKLDEWGKKVGGVLSDASAGFQTAWPQMSTDVANAATSIGADIDRIMASLNKIAGWFTGNGKSSNADWALFWVRLVKVIATAETQLVDLAANVLESITLIVDGFKALGSGDLDKLNSINARMLELAKQRDVFGRIQEIWNAATYEARASGGPVQAGQPYIVGEQRPEVFVPQTNGYIYPDAGSWGGERTLRVVVESPLPTNRQAIRELALALKREIDLTGAVMVG
jgi:SLT domain-containing protein